MTIVIEPRRSDRLTIEARLNRAVFLDRDGVLIEDVDPLVRQDDIRVIEGAPAALAALRAAGFTLVVVSNQTVVARGLIGEAAMVALHGAVVAAVVAAGGLLDAFYFCPHHPNATVPAYRAACASRKPQPGMLLRAAQELQLDLRASFMVGDRVSDIVAGQRAGCRTVLVKTGRHLEPPIESAEPFDIAAQPDHECAGLAEAAAWILQTTRS